MPRLPFSKLAARIQPAEGLRRDDWAPHPNGGGWVHKTAFASATAYVGPYAIVSGNARVLDHARVIDEASVTDTALVAGHAVIGGKARVSGHATIFGTARVLGNAQVGGEFSLHDGEVREGITRSLEGRPRPRRMTTVQLPLDV